HQTANAKALVNKDAAEMIKDNEALTKLVPEIIALSKNETLQKKLEENIGELGIKNADEKIAAIILESI
ncbi:MAG: UDP-N-acetylglucosamine--N-acetylmuramyl-(pentapeptide) pyrophosphoryl-undecaprenol N-acetylglucosamine transferase, partial [Ferruginibacter sp.]